MKIILSLFLSLLSLQNAVAKPVVDLDHCKFSISGDPAKFVSSHLQKWDVIDLQVTQIDSAKMVSGYLSCSSAKKECGSMYSEDPSVNKLQKIPYEAIRNAAFPNSKNSDQELHDLFYESSLENFSPVEGEFGIDPIVCLTNKGQTVCNFNRCKKELSE